MAFAFFSQIAPQVYNALFNGYRSAAILSMITKSSGRAAKLLGLAKSSGYSDDKILDQLLQRAKSPRQRALEGSGYYSSDQKREQKIDAARKILKTAGAAAAIGGAAYGAYRHMYPRAIQPSQILPPQPPGPPSQKALPPPQKLLTGPPRPVPPQRQLNTPTPSGPTITPAGPMITPYPTSNKPTPFGQINTQPAAGETPGKSINDMITKPQNRPIIPPMVTTPQEAPHPTSPDKLTQLEQQLKAMKQHVMPSITTPNVNTQDQNIPEKQYEEPFVPKENIRGNAIEPKNIPEKLYHVTTNKSSVEKDQKLKRGLGGGLGGVHKVVSFTSDKNIAENLKNDVKFASAFFTKFKNKFNGPLAYKILQDNAKKEGWEFQHIYDHPDFNFEKLIKEESPLSLLKEYFKVRDRQTGKTNPVILNEIYANPEDIDIVEIDKTDLPENANVRTGDEFLREVAVYNDIPLKKSVLIKGRESKPYGMPIKKGSQVFNLETGELGTIEDVTPKNLKVNANGKKDILPIDDAIPVPSNTQELDNYYEKYIKSLPEENRSSVMDTIGVDAGKRAALLTFHTGKSYVYTDLDDDDMKLLNDTAFAKTEGNNYMSYWYPGKTSVGAAVNKLVQHLQKKYGKGQEYKYKFDETYSIHRPGKAQTKEQYEKEKANAKLKKPPKPATIPKAPKPKR